jgi:hypothetical protein
MALRRGWEVLEVEIPKGTPLARVWAGVRPKFGALVNFQ